MKQIIVSTFLISLFFFGCKKNDAPSTEILVARVKTTITGIVTNEAGQFLQGASVTIEGKTVTTDKEGLFVFEDIEVPESRYYIKATLNNYFESGSGGIAVKDGVTTVQIKLLSMGTPKDVSGTAASTNTIGGATLKFDANSFTTENGTAYTGTVRVFARSINPATANFSDIIPGGDLSSTMPDGSPARLESYGMVGVELRDANNNELKLASGKEAEVRFPIASSQLSTAPATIPLLSLDPATGIWKQEGEATKVGNEYVGKVKHFSWWNCDVARFNCRIRGRVIDCDGKPLAGVKVLVNGQYTIFTNTNGYYEGMVPRISLIFQVEILDIVQNLSSSVVINTPQQGLNQIPDIKVGKCPTVITGTISRCGGNKNFYIRAIWGDNTNEGWVPTLIQSDSFRLLVPSNTKLIIRVSSGVFTKDTIISPLTNNIQNLNIGQIVGCITLPTVSTSDIINTNENSATIGGEILSNGGSPITMRGVVWSTSPNPTIVLPTKTSDGIGIGIFQSNISGLINNTKYYIRAYATNNAGTGYGTEKTFKTSSVVNLPFIVIGSQIWSIKNLDVTTYRNGDLIPQVTDSIQWASLTTGAWCYYNNDSSNNEMYGKLYNWYALNDPRGLAPQGWHVPSDAEWNELVRFVDISADTICQSCIQSVNAGGSIKSTNGWQSPNIGATNSSGFTGLPGGYRGLGGTFYDKGAISRWWSTSQDVFGLIWGRRIDYNNTNIYKYNFDKKGALSIRCIKD